MAEARVVRPDRRQLGWDMVDLSQLYERVKSREGEAGRPAADPAVMLALWLYATVEGVGSARALERLAESDAAYRWLAGGVPLNYHGLADFRVDSVEVLDRLLTQSVTALIAEGLISLGSRSQSMAPRFAPAPARSRSGRAKKCSRSKARSPSVWLRLSRSFRAIRGLRAVVDKRRGSARRVMFRSAPEERGRRSNGFRRSASRAPRHTPRTKPRRRSRKFRRPIPGRATCAFPTAQFAPPTTPRSPPRRRRASSSRSR